jgi:hypothetical protein
MTRKMRLLHRGSNGDRWFLFREVESCKLMVRHEPPISSGNPSTDLPVDAFLARKDQGREQQELRRIMRRRPHRSAAA